MMKSQREQPFVDVIEAAGGILWRKTALGRELALIHRPRYDDWTLPKGKREPGEQWQETALREVYEETSQQPTLKNFVGSIAYLANGVPKIVLFWNMAVAESTEFQPNREVNKMVWLPLEEALKKISYESERDLLTKLLSAEA
jgi:8-oxo-dGTP diphosphatase